MPKEVRERLARVQCVLVELLRHVEDREGIRLFGDERRKPARSLAPEVFRSRVAA